MAKRVKPLTKKRRRAFLEALARNGNVSASAEAAGVGRTWVYEKREAHPDFARAWDDAEARYLDTCKSIADRRATIGEEVVVRTTRTETNAEGKKVAEVTTEETRVYKSDRLLAQLLDRRHPDYARAAARRDIYPGGLAPKEIPEGADQATAARAYLDLVKPAR